MLSPRSEALKLYSNVKETSVDWLWYPYIPFGKVTLLQGDPGGGKSTLMMSIIAAVSNGTMTPDGNPIKKPMHVIYQCSEDGISDTIKPRLTKAGADCNNVAFIDEEVDPITLNDENLRRAIADFNAKLVVIDPFQAYLGDADMTNAASIRKVVRQIGLWATAYDCAIVLVGHLNKKQGMKDLYRGLGSIDIVAFARSVLQIEIREDTDTRSLRHIKSSLAPKGQDLLFNLDPNTGIQWIKAEAQDEEAEPKPEPLPERLTKQEQTARFLYALLKDGPQRADAIREQFQQKNISEKTLMNTKRYLGIESFRKEGRWFWKIP